MWRQSRGRLSQSGGGCGFLGSLSAAGAGAGAGVFELDARLALNGESVAREGNMEAALRSASIKASSSVKLASTTLVSPWR
jgi:hypothetical protein